VSSIAWSSARAAVSYSRRPQTSHTQAGKSGTVTGCPLRKMKYVTRRAETVPSWHSGQGYADSALMFNTRAP